MTRFGLVMAAALLMASLPYLNGGFAAPGYALGAVVLTMVSQIALGVFGFYTATRGRKAMAWLDGWRFPSIPERLCRINGEGMARG